MKQTLQEEKQRILQIMEQGVGDFGGPEPRAVNNNTNQIEELGNEIYSQICDLIEELKEEGMSPEMITDKVNSIAENALDTYLDGYSPNNPDQG